MKNNCKVTETLGVITVDFFLAVCLPPHRNRLASRNSRYKKDSAPE